MYKYMYIETLQTTAISHLPILNPIPNASFKRINRIFSTPWWIVLRIRLYRIKFTCSSKYDVLEYAKRLPRHVTVLYFVAGTFTRSETYVTWRH